MVCELVALALIRRCHLTEPEAAERLGLQSGSTVSYLVRSVKARAQRHPELARRLLAPMARKVVNSHFQG